MCACACACVCMCVCVCVLSCIEHILTLRLWIDYCKRKKLKLFIAFIDFSKAYDRVPRGKLFTLLMHLGCGAVMLGALMSLYSVTTCILGTVLITCTVGVRQGSPTSVFLFIIYVDVLIKMIKEKSPSDGFLSWLHLLMLMDDTVIFATSRESLKQKLSILQQYCDEYGMQINEKKTEFMVINGTKTDRENISLSGMTVKHCTSYVYLGVIVTENGSALSSLKAHAAEKKKHFNRLVIFLSRNYDAPFFVKRKVFDAAFSSAILYGSETWFDVSLSSIEKMYTTAVRCLLDVKKSTPVLTCLLEAGIPSLQAVVKEKQSKFLKRIVKEREGMLDDPLMFTLNFMKENNPAIYAEVDDRMVNCDFTKKDHENLTRTLREMPAERTKFHLYMQMNPDLSVHNLYRKKDHIEDNLRMAFTRVRLSSHRLRCETGRWSRVPSDQRVCPHCDGEAVQDEEHLFLCPATLPIREKYDVTLDLQSFMLEPSKNDLICLKQCLKLLESVKESQPDE